MTAGLLREQPGARQGQPRAGLPVTGGNGGVAPVAISRPRARHGAAQACGRARLPHAPPSSSSSFFPFFSSSSSSSRCLPAPPCATLGRAAATAAAWTARSIRRERAASPSLRPLAAPAAMELPESQCKKVKLSNRVPSWVRGRAQGEKREERRRRRSERAAGGDVAAGMRGCPCTAPHPGR